MHVRADRLTTTGPNKISIPCSDTVSLPLSSSRCRICIVHSVCGEFQQRIKALRFPPLLESLVIVARLGGFSGGAAASRSPWRSPVTCGAALGPPPHPRSPTLISLSFSCAKDGTKTKERDTPIKGIPGNTVSGIWSPSSSDESDDDGVCVQTT